MTRCKQIDKSITLRKFADFQSKFTHKIAASRTVFFVWMWRRFFHYYGIYVDHFQLILFSSICSRILGTHFKHLFVFRMIFFCYCCYFPLKLPCSCQWPINSNANVSGFILLIYINIGMSCEFVCCVCVEPSICDQQYYFDI